MCRFELDVSLLPTESLQRAIGNKIMIPIEAVRWAVNFCRTRIGIRYGVPLIGLCMLLAAMAWAHQRDPFERHEFTLQTAGGKVKGMAVLPKPVGKEAVVIYLHGHGESLLSIGNALRQIAELGMAAVGMDYDQANQSNFDAEFVALQDYVARQPWAESNATAWVGFSQGSQWTLSYLARHPERQPQLLVRLSGGWVSDLDRFANTNQAPSKFIRCPVLLVSGANDEIFPVQDTKRLAELLKAAGTDVTLHVVTGQGHTFGMEHDVVIRTMAEYCRDHLPLTDYTGALVGCPLTSDERQRFNDAMSRSGLHRRELWKAVASVKEPERHTLVNVIGGLEDYDLANVDPKYLVHTVNFAWEARRRYEWAAKTPLDIFEKYVATPRFYYEPLEDWQDFFDQKLREQVKYVHKIPALADLLWRRMHDDVEWKAEDLGIGKTPSQIYTGGPTDCGGYTVIYAAMCRSIGLAARSTRVVWQNSLEEHYCIEIWNPEDKKWHELDVADGGRMYNTPWIERVPKVMFVTQTGYRGNWNAVDEGRFDACSNTIALVYPSGKVNVKVVDHGVPVAGAPLGIQVRSTNGFFYVKVKQKVDQNGEASFDLGKSAFFPYRFFVDHPGDTAWEWQEVQPNTTNQVVLDLAVTKPFDPKMVPPDLSTQKKPNP